MFKKFVAVAVPAVILSVAAVPAFAVEGAAAWDYSVLTSSIDFSSVSVAVLAVAGILAGVYAGIKGARIVLAFLRPGT